MRNVLTPEKRLIVAADFKPTGKNGGAWVRNQVLDLANSLKDTGVCLKVNSVLRLCGYGLIEEIHSFGLSVFVDLKLCDILNTLSTDGALLFEAKPEFVTTLCVAGIDAMRALKVALPNTQVLGVTVLTSHDDVVASAMFGCSTVDAVKRFAHLAADAGLDGLISSPAEATMLRAKFGERFSLNTPAIRPAWSIVKGDDQNPDRIMTPEKAIKAGADRLVIGRPIVEASSPYDAVRRTLDEISSAMA